VRVDSHAYAEYVIPPHYDSMIGKLIVHAPTREEAIKRGHRALDEYIVEGVKTTIPFYQEIMDSTEFIWGTFDTGFLSRRRIGPRRPQSTESEQLAAVVAAMIEHEEGRHAVAHIGQGVNGATASQRATCGRQAGRMRAQRGQLVKYYARIGSNEYEVDITASTACCSTASRWMVDLVRTRHRRSCTACCFGGHSHEMLIAIGPLRLHRQSIRGEQFHVQVAGRARPPAQPARASCPPCPTASWPITAPIPGLVVKVLVQRRRRRRRRAAAGHPRSDEDGK
jgi:acetyl/propionyl-CoA carboxylase alpha subunit